jgi:hypothetical protein
MDSMDNNPPMDEPPAPPDLPAPYIPEVPPAPAAGPPLSWWLKKFIACNPFYLFSAALLLYGLYLVSADANFPGHETAQLLFNFGSLQVYELLLVGTAILLASRRIWYDSMLLVGLENLLVLAPFILINQATLLGPKQAPATGMIWGMCVVGGVAAGLRFWSLKKFFKELNLPGRALVCGLMLLLVNLALPLLYRHFEETRLGAQTTDGAQYEMNRYGWLLLLPAMFALVNLLPRARRTGGLSLPQHPWLPVGFFLLWMGVSGAHLYSLGYVYNLDFEFIFSVPILWVMAWTVYLRHDDFLAAPNPVLSKILLAAPALAAFPALATPDTGVFLVLMVTNLAAYAWLAFRSNRVALHLALVSLAGLAVGLVKLFEAHLPESVTPGRCLLFAAAAYALFWMFRTRNPKAGVVGALGVLLATVCFAHNSALGPHLGMQLGLVFLLLHSLRWEDGEHAGAGAVRISAAVGWLMHSGLLVYTGFPEAMRLVDSAGGLMLAVCVITDFLRRNWRPLAPAVAAALVLLLQPAGNTAGKLHSTPTGLLAVLGSFLLFGLGTLAALTRSKWHGPPAADAVPAPNDLTKEGP